MLWAEAALIACLTGVLIGYAAERLPLRSVLQCLTAAFFAMPVAAVATIVFSTWTLRDNAYWGFGLEPESVFLLAALALCAGVLHLLLERTNVRWVTRHRPIICGSFGAAWGAVPIAWAVSVSTRILAP